MAVKLVKGQYIASYKCTYWWVWSCAWQTKGLAGSGMQWVTFPAALWQSRWDCSNLMGVLTRRILELMNGDKLPFPQVTRMLCFSLWLLSLQYPSESIYFVVVLLTPGRQCFLLHGVSGTHRKHTEELCSAGPLTWGEWLAVQISVSTWNLWISPSNLHSSDGEIFWGSSQGYSERENVEGNWRFYGNGCKSVWSLGSGVSY